MPKKKYVPPIDCKQYQDFLNMCSLSGGLCSFADEPAKCPDYKNGQEKTRTVHNYSTGETRTETIHAKPKKVDTDEDFDIRIEHAKHNADIVNTETASEFVDRIEGELDAMGIKVIREPDELMPIAKPVKSVELPPDF